MVFNKQALNITMKTLLTSIALISTLLGPFIINAEENRLANSTHNNQTLYVDDELWITVRAEPDTEAERVAVIQSGTRMTVLNYTEGEDFAQVRTENDHTGWVLVRYLTSEPVASLRLAQVEKNLTRLQETNNQLNDTLSKLKTEKRELDERTQELDNKNKILNKDLDEIRTISSDAVQTFQQKQTLLQELNTQKENLGKLEEDNHSLSSRLMMFTIGAGVFGLLAGLYIGTIPLRRDKRWRSIS
jgi:SH3 domain protein